MFLWLYKNLSGNFDEDPSEEIATCIANGGFDCDTCPYSGEDGLCEQIVHNIYEELAEIFNEENK